MSTYPLPLASPPSLSPCPADHLTCRALNPLSLCFFHLHFHTVAHVAHLAGFSFAFPATGTSFLANSLLLLLLLALLCSAVVFTVANLISYFMKCFFLAPCGLSVSSYRCCSPKIELEKSIVKHINLLAAKLHRGGKFIFREMCGEKAKENERCALKVVQLDGCNCHGWHKPRVCCHIISTVVQSDTPAPLPPLHFISDHSRKMENALALERRKMLPVCLPACLAKPCLATWSHLSGLKRCTNIL